MSNAAATLTSTISAETLKLRKRPAWWILLGILLVAVVLFGYLFSYLFIVGGTDIPGMDADDVLQGLLPASVLQVTVSQLAGIGGPIALILAALFVGSEYSWGTTKTIATQRPSRAQLAVGKSITLAGAMALLVVATLVLAVVASLAIAAVEGESAALPAVGEILRGAAAAWLILAAYAGLGALLATLFRGIGLAIGLGLVYYFVIETMVLTLPLPDWFQEAASQALLTPNGLALSSSFGSAPMGPGMPAGEMASAGQAAVVLGLYVIAFTVATVALFSRRPVE